MRMYYLFFYNIILIMMLFKRMSKMTIAEVIKYKSISRHDHEVVSKSN